MFLSAGKTKNTSKAALENTVQNRISFQRLSSKKVGFSMIEIKNLSKSFQTADGTVEALKNVTITVPDGDIYWHIGMSGAEKVPLFDASICWNAPQRGLL